MSIKSVVNDTVTSESIVNALKPLPPTIISYTISGIDDTALDPAGGQTVQINGTGFLPGATITFDGSAVSVVTYVNPNQLSFTTPAKSAGTYTIYVVNSDGGTAIYIPGIIYSVLPTWTTTAGTLGSYYETTNISNTVVASGDAPITYSLFSGSLPTGASLATNGIITGTAPVDSSSTTYSFTIKATDAQLQDSTRSFSLTINTDVVTWVSPANATTYTSAVNSAISNVVLSATDAAGYSVSYSANALPTGLSLSGANISGTPTVIADSSTLLTATAATTNRTATRTINWSITVANDVYFEYNTLLIPGASTTFVDDASTNNFAVTINGDTKPNNFNPYTPGYYSVSFNGSSSIGTFTGPTIGTGDYTIEFWVYFNVIGTDQDFYQTYSGATINILLEFDGAVNKIRHVLRNDAGTSNFDFNSTSSIVAGTWYHIAFVLNGTSAYTFINGNCTTLGATATSSGTRSGTYTNTLLGALYSGARYLNGNMSNFRFVKGTALYTSNFTPSTIPLTAISGTALLVCQSNRFIDNSTNNYSLGTISGLQIKSFQPFTPNSSYSTYGSGYFDGTGDYLTVPQNAAFNFGTGDFTVEGWYYFTSIVTSQGLVILGGGANAGGPYTGWWFDYESSGILRFYRYAGGSEIYNSFSITLVTNTWYHIACTRSGTNLRMFVNGTQVGTTATTSTSFDNVNSDPLQIGKVTTGQGDFYFNGYITDARVVKGTAVYTTAFTPPSAPLTAISGTSLLVLQNNQSVNNSVFLDNSTNNFLVTRAGNTTQGTFSPYGGNWSNYFDGTGDYLVAPAGTAIMGTSDFTIELWVYHTAGGAWAGYYYQGEGGSGGGLNFRKNNLNQLSLSHDAVVDVFTTTATVPINQWVHIALTRSSGTIKSFINGVVASTTTYATSFTGSAGTQTIGSITSGAYLLVGYISNFRVVKGTAVYTAAFTPPTTPLTAITGTEILTCQSNRLIDNSIKNNTLTKAGDVSVQRFSPFNPASITPTSYSGYFDGSGDYLTTPASVNMNIGTGNFTFETWVFPTINSAGQALISIANTNAFYLNASGIPYYTIYFVGDYALGSTAVTLNTWSHLAFVRSGTTITCYINGTSVGSITNSASIGTSVDTNYIGSHQGGNYWNGYLSNTRVVKGIAVYTGAFTVPTTPLTATQSSGTNIAAITGTSTSLLTLQSPTFIDNSTNNFTITAFGNSQPRQQNPFGFTSALTNGYTVSTIGGSGYFDGTGDYLSIPANAAFQFTGNYTVEFWIYFSPINNNADIVGNYASNVASDWILLTSSSTIQYYPSSANSYISSPTIVANTWYHVAAVRSGTTCSLYLNGVAAASTLTFSGTLGDNTKPVYVGARGGASGYTSGYISNIRIVKSAIYTSNFVPPAAPLDAVQNSSLLLSMTNAGVYDAAMMNNMETVADAKLSTAVSKFGGSSMSFDGSGDYISLKNPGYNYTFYAGNWTIESWIYTTSSATAQTIFLQYGNTADVIKLYCNGATGTVSYQLRGTNQSLISADSASSLLSLNTWTHIAMVRDTTTTIKIYVSGTLALTATIASTTTFTEGGSSLYAEAPVIGAKLNTTSDYFVGYMDDFRITKGYARYTTNFTPATTALQTN